MTTATAERTMFTMRSASSGADQAPLLGSPGRAIGATQLHEIEALKEFPREGLEGFRTAGRVRSFAPGARIMLQGEEATSFHVILAGRVRVQRSHPSLSTPLVLAELGKGEVVGEMGILDGERRSATVVAVDQVEALEIEAEALLRIVQRVPGVAGAFLKLVSRRLRTLDEVVEEALTRLHRQQELILSSVDEGICMLDASGVVTFANPAAARMLGYAVDQLCGQKLHELIHPGCTGAEPECLLASPLAGRAIRRGTDEAIRRRNGSTFPAEFVSLPLWEGESPLGALFTFQDATERKAVERMKDQFVSIVSHELRTPLTSIRGSLGLLASGQLGALPERARRMVEIADNNTDRLVRLINDLLDIERMQSGKVTMETVDTSAGELMRQAADVMRPMAEKAGVRLIVEPLDVALFADPDRVLQTLTNLLSNAIKFSPAGGRVWLEGERKEGAVEIRVRDEGRGIPKGKQGLIFERFQQVDSSDAREKGGTGLGLPICRSIVEQHGGRIWVESQCGQGSTFALTLPLSEIPERETQRISGDHARVAPRAEGHGQGSCWPGVPQGSSGRLQHASHRSSRP